MKTFAELQAQGTTEQGVWVRIEPRDSERDSEAFADLIPLGNQGQVTLHAETWYVSRNPPLIDMPLSIQVEVLKIPQRRP